MDSEVKSIVFCPKCGAEVKFILGCRNLECGAHGCPECMEFDGANHIDYFCTKDCIVEFTLHTMMMKLMNHGSTGSTVGKIEIVSEALKHINVTMN